MSDDRAGVGRDAGTACVSIRRVGSSGTPDRLAVGAAGGVEIDAGDEVGAGTDVETDASAEVGGGTDAGAEVGAGTDAEANAGVNADAGPDADSGRSAEASSTAAATIDPDTALRAGWLSRTAWPNPAQRSASAPPNSTVNAAPSNAPPITPDRTRP
ncbi:hypothetical protein [Burkholderia cenocepacia]|uniref:hypothetical protein n=1 Tax=Burkholderia cenocepacia TaxID=95486 RepID=UPI002AB303A3|nr:hypothetical protein [Burkholderia cenocepacia]